MRRRKSRHLPHNGLGLACLLLLGSYKVTLASPVSSRPSCMQSTLGLPTPVASGLAIVGYRDGDVGRPLQVPYGKVAVTDGDRMLWGYCREERIGDDACRLAGATSSYSSICTTAIWTRRDGAAFTSLGCGPTATTAHILERPIHRVFIGQGTFTAVLVETGYEAAQATETGAPASGAESYDAIETTSTIEIVKTIQTDYPTPQPPPPPQTPPAPPLASPAITASPTGSDQISTHPSPSSSRPAPSATETPATTTTSAAAESTHGGGLALGQIAGIVVGSTAGAALLALGALYVAWCHLASRFGMAMASICMTLRQARPAPAAAASAHPAGP
ncbi:hypothetical protein PpBr36_00679 [Pyricularia pennisetigena]|uniref:hypothetical protein n=1 Tax=Pyricularia pennisetigena TaxID=1578925 RepID=UPI001153AC2D|nr:hypothetical protein PpBr36_00679 [Pyricularia pennisetigena]TLS28574.1 hypothetical protein PpBr36_00679 [Pyricularia pennisetigena]